MPHPDFNSYLTLGGWLFIGVIFLVGLFVAIRHGTSRAIKQASEEWERVAKAREAALEDLRRQEAAWDRERTALNSRLTDCADRNDHLTRMNQELQALNISLQNQSAQQQNLVAEQSRKIAEQGVHISELENRIRQMEQRCLACLVPASR